MRKVALISVLSAAIALVIVGNQYLIHGSASEGAKGAASEGPKGTVILLRHVDANVGRDSSDNLVLDDCTTQRNLNDNGREQARHLGQHFRTGGLLIGKIVTSPMCRAIETARLLDIGPAEHSLEFVDLTNNRRIADQLIKKERDIIARWNGPGTLIIVTHSSNIKALTNLDIDPGDMVVLEATTTRWRFVSLSD